MQLRTRFAPSPTGLLHVGNAYSALFCQQWAAQHNATCLLRIEDIDHTRCRPHYSRQMLTDLEWLGFRWQEPLRRQSQHHDDYRQALAQLRDGGFIYPCFCSRKMRQSVVSACPCRQLSADEQQQRMQQPFAWRLDAEAAMQAVGGALSWQDGDGRQHPVQLSEDVVIGRKDIGFSYHLCVVVDDAIQQISHVIRGEDLRDSTPIHRLLQQLLQLPTPIYIHHPLLRDRHGARLAKRIRSTTLQSLREMQIDAEKLRHFLLHASNHRWLFDEPSSEHLRRALGKAA